MHSNATPKSTDRGTRLPTSAVDVEVPLAPSDDAVVEHEQFEMNSPPDEAEDAVEPFRSLIR